MFADESSFDEASAHPRPSESESRSGSKRR